MSFGRAFKGSLDKAPTLRRRWLESVIVPYVTNGAFAAAGRVFLSPIVVPWKVEIDRIVYLVHDVVAGNVRVGLYKEGSTQDSPVGGELMCESGSEAQPGNYRLHHLTVPDTILEPGLYFGALQGDDVTGTFKSWRLFGEFGGVAEHISWVFNQAYGAFTDPCPAVSGESITPALLLRVKRDLV